MRKVLCHPFFRIGFRILFLVGWIWLIGAFLLSPLYVEGSFAAAAEEVRKADVAQFSREEVREKLVSVFFQVRDTLPDQSLPAFLILLAWLGEVFPPGGKFAQPTSAEGRSR